MKPQAMILECGDYRLVLRPERGGLVERFDWRGKAVFRPAYGEDALESACFALVPFSNRIRGGTFDWRGRAVALAPNVAGFEYPLHGFGWLVPWHVTRSTTASAQIEHGVDGRGEWPWAYRAEQQFLLDENGLTIVLSLENRSDEAMPAGLGLHPYFERDADTVLCSLHKGEWHNDAACIPHRLEERPAPVDWWGGASVGTRSVDAAYTGRAGDLVIEWPSREMSLTISPSDNLGFTVIYTPADEDFFCVEPVSHMTDAVNRAEAGSGLVALAPGDRMEASVRFEVQGHG